MPVRSFKKSRKSIVAGSPAIEEHEQMLSQLNQEATVPEDSTSAPTASRGVSAGNNVGVFSTLNTEPLKNVQTRVPLSIYEKLNRMKYFAGQHTSIGDIVAKAISEYCERHPV